MCIRDRLEPTFEGDGRGMIHNANINFSPEWMAKLYNTADVHVVSSSGESFCLPTLEAMASGTPVIMPNNTTGPELVKESGAGLLAECKLNVTVPIISDISYVDPFDLAKQIETIYKDEKLRMRCSRNGIKFAQKFKWDIIIKKWVKLFDAIPYLS